MKRIILLIICVALCGIVSAQSIDTTFTVYGPRKFIRSSGTPITVTENFMILPAAQPPYRLYIINGESDGSNRVSSAEIKMNGTLILRQSEINQQIAFLERQVNLSSTNRIEVQLTSQPRSFLVIGIAATDRTPPRLTVTSPPDVFIAASTPVTVAGTVFDETVVSLTINGVSTSVGSNGSFSRQVSLTEGRNTITVRAADAFGNSSTQSRLVILDTMPPVLTVQAPANDFITNQSFVNVAGAVIDSTAVTVTANGSELTVAPDGSFSGQVQLSEGSNFITFTANDAAGNTSGASRNVIRDTAPPLLTITSPSLGAITNLASIQLSGTIIDSTAVSLSVNGANVAVNVDGTFAAAVTLTEGSNAIALTASDAAGNTTSATRTVIRDSSPPVITLSSPSEGLVTGASSVQVTGTVVDSTAVTLTVNGTPVPVGSNASFTTELTLVEGLNTVTVVATDAAGNTSTATRSVTRSSLPPVLTLTFPMDRTVVGIDSVQLTGAITSTSAVTLFVNGIAKNVNPNGSFSFKVPIIEGKNNFVLIATDALGQRDSAQVSVIRDTRQPLLNLISPAWTPYTTDSTIVVMGSVVDSTGVTVSINGAFQQLDRVGSFQSLQFLTPGLNTFAIQAADQAGNTTTALRTIERVQKVSDPAAVAPQIDRTVTTTVASATEFLYTGSDPIQKNVAPGTINPLRVTALRGKVLNQLQLPLSGVTVTVNSHPEFGFTLSRDDGLYDLAVNGGENLTLDFTRPGFLPAQRSVDAKWNSYGAVDAVVLLAMDTLVHHVDFLTSTGVQGSSVTDELGTRKPTVFFKQGTQASLVFQRFTNRTVPGCIGVPQKILSSYADSLVPISGITLRVQEYSISADGEKALPAPLPPTVAYSFAFELQADEVISRGAVGAQFSQSATLLLENIMNFPEGMLVPLGFYDRTKASWLPAENGRVIKILGSSGGFASIDFDGDNIAEHRDSLVAIGISYDEQQFLATVYGAGQSLLRVTFAKLGTYAIGFGFVLPTNAKAPSNPPPDRYAKVDRDNIVAGSVIGVQNQMLSESVPITNTTMSLHYRSDRVEGRREAYTLDIPLTGAVAPENVLRVEVEVEVAGQVTKMTYPPQANLSFHYVWDGKDVYGRKLQGQQNVLTTINYYYQTQYAIPADWSKSFSTPSGQAMIRYIPGRKEMAKTQLWEGKIGAFDILSLGIGGWSLSQHHGYDVLGRILYTGDGQVRSARVMDNVITTIAGIPTAWQNQTCAPQYSAPLPAAQIPMGVSASVRFTANGSLLLSENYMLRRIDTSGIITTLGGLSSACRFTYPDTTAGILANCGTFGPFDILEGPDKSIYLADGIKQHIWRITPEGELKHFAGVFYNTGPFGYNCFADGDGGPALQAHFGRFSEMAFGSDGSLYVADMFNHRIRKISPDGIVTTVAGSAKNYNEAGYGGDGGAAIKARMNEIRGFALGPDGSLFISDYRNHRIRKVTPDGIITTIAGTGIQGSTGDGGLAVFARVGYPYNMTVGNDGTLYFCETGGKVRAVSTDGYIKTVVGGGSTVWLQDGPATAAIIGPQDVEFGKDGNLYVSDWPPIFLPPRIFRVGPPLPGLKLSEILIASEDGSEQYVFTLSGRHLRTLDALTGVVKYSFNYDAASRLVSIVDVDSLVTRIERDAQGVASAIVSPYGVRTELTIDSSGHLLIAANPAAEVRNFTYSSGGLMTSMTDARGSTYFYTYDSLGYLTEDRDPAGGFTRLTRTYDSTGYTITATTAMGKKTMYRVDQLRDGTKQFITTDPNGLRTITTDRTDGSATGTTPDGTSLPSRQKPDPRFGMQAPLGAGTLTTPAGVKSNLSRSRVVTQMSGTAVTGMTDTIVVNGKPHRRIWDGIQRKIASVSPEGRQTFKFFDSKGRIVKDSTAGLTPTTYVYDLKGRKIESNQGGRRTRFEYDSFGRLSKVIGPNNKSTQFSYDGADRLTKTVLPDLSEINLSYDQNGNVVTVAPPGRPAHNFTFTANDLASIYQPPFAGDSARSTQTDYTLDKEVAGVNRPDSLNIVVEYGGPGSLAGAPKRIIFDRGEAILSYDTTKGLLVRVVSPSSDSLTYSYDGQNIKTISYSGTVKGNVAFAYNSELQAITEKVNNADSANFSYDKDGLLTVAGKQKRRYSSLNNLLLSDTVGNAITNYGYNTLGELVTKQASVSNAVLSRFDLVRDSLGRIIQRTDTIQGVATKFIYTYDDVGRLASVSRNDTLIATYGYDSNGNRIVRSGMIDTTLGAYDDQDRLLIYGNAQYLYSKYGDLRSKIVGLDTTKYTYDAFGNLVVVQTSDGNTIEYIIDGENRRIGRKVNGKLLQRWLYSNALRIVAELDSTNQIVSRFVYATSDNVPEYMIKGGTTYRFITDQVGSVKLVVNAQSGVIAQRMDYDEFGSVLVNTNPDFQPFGFAAGLLDSKTGLTRFGVRDYDASVGRWTTKDPILFQGSGVNLYVYALNDPLNLTDPTGRYIASPKQVWMGLAGGIIQAGFSVLRGEDATKIVQSFAIGALTGLIGAGEFSGPLSRVAVGTALGFGANLSSQKWAEGRSWSSLSGAQLAFSSISGFAAAAYGELFEQDLAGAALMITIFVSIQQTMILSAVH